MILPRALGLRGRLILLLTTAFAGLGVLAALYLVHASDVQIKYATAELIADTRLIAARQEAFVARADAILNGLMLSPEQAQTDSAEGCARLLAARLAREPEFAEITKMLPNGDSICAAIPRAGPLNVADRPYFQRTLQAHEMIVSDVVIGRILGVPVIVFGKAIRDTNGRATGALFISLGLDWLRQELAKIRLPEGATLTVRDSRGAITVRYPDPEAWNDKVPAQFSGMQHALAAGRTGAMDGTGLDGKRRLFAYTPLFTGASGSNYYLWLSIPQKVPETPAQRDALFALGIMLAVLTGTIVWVVVGTNRVLLKPILKLSQTATRLKAGDLGARSGLPHGDDEIGRLAETLDHTAAAMQDRELRVANANRALQRLNQELEDKVQARSRRVREEVEARREAEARLALGEKLRVVGQLTAGVAHDFNNLLAVVLGSLELLRKRLPPGDHRAQRLLDNAVQGGERGAVLTQRLLAFGRRQTLRPEPVDLAVLVPAMSPLLRSSVGTGVHVEIRVSTTLPHALVDANQLELALLNFATNARDAMAGAGRLTIAAREEPAAPDAAAGSYVVLSVTDTGTGMDEATLARATEPFFTSKGVGRGTGLGLSMVHGLAAQSGGKLVLHSTPGEGTTAELWLPRAVAAGLTLAPPPAEVAAPPSEPLRRHTVLVVDDDSLVLASTVAMLEDLGHTPVEAVSGRQALEMLRAGVRVDLVVTDQSMPGMTGVQFAVALRRLRPDLPLLLATGYAERAEVAESGLLVLAKPFDEQALEDAIGACLKAPAGDGKVVAFRPHPGYRKPPPGRSRLA